MFKKIKFALLVLLALLSIGLYLIYNKVETYLSVPRIQTTELFVVSTGSNFSRLGNQFIEKGVIENTLWWKITGKLYPALTHIKLGTYQFEKGANLRDILVLLSQGIEHQFKVTFVEGSTFKEWLQILNKTEHLTALNQSEGQLLSKLGSSTLNLEGLLFPETYHFHANMPAFKIIEKAYLHQQQVLAKLWAGRDKNLPLKSPYEALVLASIIEKESSIGADRDKISSVFINRLRKGMRLQTDPTVIYGMGDNYKGRIRSRDLRRKTAYNTYRINGLPPTPICMPSEAALYAALHPVKSDYLYFVSKGDGTSYFSKSLIEHNRAVQKYILGK